MVAIGLETLAALWAIVSGLAICLLGILSLRGGVSRPWGALPLGLFALVWGLNLVLGNAPSIIEDASLAEPLVLGSLITLFPLPYFLIEFAREQVFEPDNRRFWLALRVVTAGAAIGGSLLFALRPTLFLGGISYSELGVVADWGVGWTVFKVLFFAALGVTLVALYKGFEKAPTPRVRHRAAVLTAGLGVYVAYTSAQNLAFFSNLTARFDVPGQTVVFTLLFALLTVAIVYLGLQILSRLSKNPDPAERTRLRWMLAALAVPLAWGAVEGYVLFAHAPRMHTAGLWRLVGLGIVTYGVARWRIFDLPQRVQRIAGPSLGVTGAVAGGATVFGLTSLVTTSLVLPASGGLLVSALGIVPGIRYARQLFEGSDTDEDAGEADKLYGEKIDAYRAALEASIARGTLDEDEAFLESLRERFGLGEEANQVLRHLAEEAVVMPTGERLHGTYERLRLLGEGGSARTWLARDRARDRLVVLKEPVARWQSDDALLDRVLQEARAMARIDHPNVVQVHEVVDDDGLPVLVMEYADGGSLETMLRNKGVLGWQRAVDVVDDLLAGLAAVHATGLLHRDVKPANVLMTGDGHAKLGDLGIAQASGGGETVIETDAGTTGTPMYMAPEVRAGQPHSQASDVYACGAVLYELLYGSPPAREGAVRAENDVPEPLKAVVAKATAQDPAARYSSAETFIEALDEVRPT